MRAAGYEGGQSILYDYLRGLNGTVLPEKATVRFETAPGQQGQFDWSPYTVSLGDELRQVIVYGMTLGYSRRKHYTASLDERQASIFEALEECLWHFAGASEPLEGSLSLECPIPGAVWTLPHRAARLSAISATDKGQGRAAVCLPRGAVHQGAQLAQPGALP